MATSALATVERLVSPISQQAHALKIVSTDDYELACTFLQLIARRKLQVGETFDPIVGKALAAHREAVAQRKKFLDPLLQAESITKGKIAAYRADVERQRRAEERKLQAAAIAQAQADAAAQAEQLRTAGEPELAEITIQEATSAPAPVVVLESSISKQEGISGRKTWKYRIVDESLIPREFLSPDPVKIGAVVRSQKALTRIPGLEVYFEDSVAVRAGGAL